MNQPLYSFALSQSGSHMLVDACVPFGVGIKIFEVISAAAAADRVPVATKRPPNVPLLKPEFAVNSVTTRNPSKKSVAKRTPKPAKRRSSKASN
jgi:hypothetical protein